MSDSKSGSEVDKAIPHTLEIIHALTVSKILKWERKPLGFFVSSMGPFEVYIDTRKPYSENKPLLNIYAYNSCNAYNFSFAVCETASSLNLVKTSI